MSMLAFVASVAALAQNTETFKPYKNTALRLPSVPLVVSDPYFSIWSPYDKLTDGDTRHWTNDEKPLEGLLRVDGKTYRFMGSSERSASENSSSHADVQTAKQKSVSVLATSTYYTFACGPVDLDVVFTAPMLINDYDLLSSPVNYISYQVRSTDNKAHDVQFYLGASTLLAVNKSNQPTVSSTVIKKGVTYLKTGTIEQPILAKTGDGICIDWGYLYLPNINGEVSLALDADIKASFLANGTLPKSHDQLVSRKPATAPTLAYMHNFGSVSQASSYALIGYDEIEDIEYMYHRYKGYWAHNGNVSIFDQFEKLNSSYSSIMQRCRQWDKQLYDDAFAAGNAKYAEILSGSYRHVIAAHKLFQDKDGNLLFFSKENNSNGCVNTVDLTYPEAPLFLVYNPELQKAMMTSIFDYSLSGRWTKPFAAHDLGQYPKANGQVYGGDMPLEEAGNMITLAATIAKLEGNTHYVDKYWDLLKTWTDYLVDNGQDPANQLCTDDFAGHMAHNCNLSLKAIMGIAGLGILYGMKGRKRDEKKYISLARSMAEDWAKRASNGDGSYRLAFDSEGSFSMKYNIVWDKLFGTGIMSREVIASEVASYFNRMHPYGLPLDNRKPYTKSDWLVWTATLADDRRDFEALVAPLWDAYNYTPSRVPMSDWYYTLTGEHKSYFSKSAQMDKSFRNRTVQGGLFIKLLEYRGIMKLSK